jgi:hypothetical protein
MLAIFPGRCIVGCRRRGGACTNLTGTRGISGVMGTGLESFRTEGECVWQPVASAIYYCIVERPRRYCCWSLICG